MVITWHGFSCVKIVEPVQGGEVTVVTDPFAPVVGAKLPRNLAADLITISHDHPRHNNKEAVGGTPFVITEPGEYEVKDVFVTGVQTFHDLVEGKEKGTNAMYTFVIGGVHLVHLGDLKHPLEEKRLEEFHDIDVLFVPVGGGDVLDGKQAAEVVGQLEPRIVIPIHYGADGAGQFLKAMGLGKPEILPKLKITSKDLPQDEMKIILLEQQ